MTTRSLWEGSRRRDTPLPTQERAVPLHVLSLNLTRRRVEARVLQKMLGDQAHSKRKGAEPRDSCESSVMPIGCCQRWRAVTTGQQANAGELDQRSAPPPT